MNVLEFDFLCLVSYDSLELCFHVSPLTLIPLMGIQCLHLSLLFIATALMVCVISFCLAIPAMFSFVFAKKLTPFHKKNKPRIKHGGCSVMVWGPFAPSGPRWLDWNDGTMNSALYQKSTRRMSSQQFLPWSSSTLELCSKKMSKNMQASLPL